MRKLYFLTFVLLAFGAGAQSTFNTVVGTTSGDWAYAVIEDSDGNIIVGGKGTQNVSQVTKMTSYGDTLWTRVLSGFRTSDINAIMETNDDHYIMVGDILSFGEGSQDMIVSKVDFDGNLLWSRAYGGSDSEIARSVKLTSDNKYAVFGYSKSVGVGSADYYFMKLDTDGTVLEKRNVGGNNIDHGHEILPTTDGGYLMVGSTISYGQGSDDIMVIRTDDTGVPVWRKTFGGTLSDACYAAVNTADGNYAVLSTSWSYTSTGGAYLLKIDDSGDTLWTRTYAHPTENLTAYGIDVMADGGFVIGGYLSNSQFGDDDGFILRTDANGDLLWSKVYGGADRERAEDITAISDGGIVIAGTNVSVQPTYGMWIVKTDGNGVSGCAYADAGFVQGNGAAVIADVFPSHGPGTLTINVATWDEGIRYPVVDTLCASDWPNTVSLEEEVKSFSSVVYPNPSNGKVSIKTIHNQGQVQIVSSLGVLIGEWDLNKAKSLDLNHLPKGVYFMQISTANEVETIKFVLE